MTASIGLVHSQTTPKKYEIEVTLGLGSANSAFVYDRAYGIGTMLDQYARHYGRTVAGTGEINESKRLMPFGAAVNYHLKNNLYLTGGIDYSTGGNSWENTFQVSWPDFDETHAYEWTKKVTVIMPRIGAGYRYGSFDFYGGLGLGIARLSYVEELAYSEPGYSYDLSDTYKLKGTAPGFIIGAKYRLKLNDRGLAALVKVEALLMKVKSLSGTKERAGSDSVGSRVSETSEGTVYGYNWDPYDVRGFDFWDVFEALPTDSSMGSFEEVGLNLSGIRFMVGVSF
jgi:hypothetical protein